MLTKTFLLKCKRRIIYVVPYSKGSESTFSVVFVAVVAHRHRKSLVFIMDSGLPKISRTSGDMGG